MKVIGLTGGIGSGKSAVSTILKKNDILVVDTDEISRQITRSALVLKEIKTIFGRDVLNEDGSLNRKKMADIVFNDSDSKRILEKIVTEKVISLTEKILYDLRKENSQDIVVIDAPLLFECGVDRLTDINWLVICDTEKKIKRVMKRENYTRNQVLERMKNQMSDFDKMKKSQVIIDNSGTFKELESRVEKLILDIKG